MSSPSKHLLAGKTAAITGGTTGIGRAIALEFLHQGCHVVVNHLNLPRDKEHKDWLVKAADALRVSDPTAGHLLLVEGDVTKPQTGADLVARAVERFGELNIFVSNAGICQFVELLDIEPEHFASTIDINLNGAFYCCQAAARQMIAQGKGGSIIGISSISALVGGGQQVHYTPSKAGILSLMQSMAIAAGIHGVRCNALLPGTIRTQLNEEDLSNDRKREYTEGRIPLGRTGKPEDMAGPAVFLGCDELSGYVNGAQILVDGGMFVNLQ